MWMIFQSCRKDKLNLSPQIKLELRADTLWFDTVFTNASQTFPKSVNKQIVIVNPSNDRIQTNIELMGGSSSHFRLNVDGVPGSKFEDLELFPNDSLFLFVEVHPDPNNNSPDFNPLIIRDSILFNTNGNEQKVNLIGWGQDAHYIFRDSIESDTTWANDKLPIVIYGYCYVKPNVKLTIEKGMKIHSAPYSWLFVEGELEIKGTVNEPVLMQGDRLQPNWEETPGQWGGLWFSYPTLDNRLEHAIIKNATVGVYCDSTSGDNNASPNVIINKCFIRNMSFDGVAGKGSNIRLRNSVVANCGRFTFLASFGGDYDIRHGTFHTGSKDFSRRDPNFAILNINRNSTGAIISQHPLDFYMANSIVDGNFEDGEIGTDLNGSANVTIEYSALRTLNSAFDVNNNLINLDTLFIDDFNYNYRLDSLSSLKNKGRTLVPPIAEDLDEDLRDAQPDPGAYESDF